MQCSVHRCLSFVGVSIDTLLVVWHATRKSIHDDGSCIVVETESKNENELSCS